MIHLFVLLAIFKSNNVGISAGVNINRPAVLAVFEIYPNFIGFLSARMVCCNLGSSKVYFVGWVFGMLKL